MQAVDSPKEFHGRRSQGEATVIMTMRSGSALPLPLRLDVRNHSPMGFEWGYGGSGPAQLALAMCCALVDEPRAERVYQAVKDELVAGLSADTWTIPADQVRGAIERLSAVADVEQGPAGIDARALGRLFPGAVQRLAGLLRKWDALSHAGRDTPAGAAMRAELRAFGAAAATFGDYEVMSALDNAVRRTGQRTEALNELWDGLGGWVA